MEHMQALQGPSEKLYLQEMAIHTENHNWLKLRLECSVANQTFTPTPSLQGLGIFVLDGAERSFRARGGLQHQGNVSHTRASVHTGSQQL